MAASSFMWGSAATKGSISANAGSAPDTRAGICGSSPGSRKEDYEIRKGKRQIPQGKTSSRRRGVASTLTNAADRSVRMPLPLRVRLGYLYMAGTASSVSWRVTHTHENCSRTSTGPSGRPGLVPGSYVQPGSLSVRRAPSLNRQNRQHPKRRSTRVLAEITLRCDQSSLLMSTQSRIK